MISKQWFICSVGATFVSHQGWFTSVFTAGSQLWLLFVPDNLITTVMLLMSEVKIICLRFFSAYEFIWGGKKTSIQMPRAFFWVLSKDVLYVLFISACLKTPLKDCRMSSQVCWHLLHSDEYGLLCVNHLLKMSLQALEWADDRVLIWKLIKRGVLLCQHRWSQAMPALLWGASSKEPFSVRVIIHLKNVHFSLCGFRTTFSRPW